MRFRRVFGRILLKICDYFTNKWFLIILYTKSLFFNYHFDCGYFADTLMEPMFWFVDNFTHLLGPVSHQLFKKIVSLNVLYLSSDICYISDQSFGSVCDHCIHNRSVLLVDDKQNGDNDCCSDRTLASH